MSLLQIRSRLRKYKNGIRIIKHDVEFHMLNGVGTYIVCKFYIYSNVSTYLYIDFNVLELVFYFVVNIC